MMAKELTTPQQEEKIVVPSTKKKIIKAVNFADTFNSDESEPK